MNNVCLFVFNSTERSFSLLFIFLIDVYIYNVSEKGLFFSFLAGSDGFLTGWTSVVNVTKNVSEENVLIVFHLTAFTFYFETKRKFFS